MIDYKRIATSSRARAVIDPGEIFNRLPKARYMNDLHLSQAVILDEWFKSRGERDTVIKLNTGGGKTLIGLLIALSSARELGQGALYLVDSKQLARQVCEQARSVGISASEYNGKGSLTAEFKNGKTILVAHYQALFNGKSVFGLESSGEPVRLSAVIIDDAHASFDSVREGFSLTISAHEDAQLYHDIAPYFRDGFASVDKETTFDEFVAGTGSISEEVLEVPFWSWINSYKAISGIISSQIARPEACVSDSTVIHWPIIKNDLKYCTALISRDAITISPLLPFVDKLPSFRDAPRRIYMSATFSDESAIVKTYGCEKSCLHVISPESLAGVGRRMILQVGGNESYREVLCKKMKELAARGIGVVVLEPSYFSAQKRWGEGFEIIESKCVDGAVGDLKAGLKQEPVVFVNRYNGIDLPDDACRLLVVSGVPKAMHDYSKLRSNQLLNSRLYARHIAQKIEQAIGRGTRGSGDYCVVVLVGDDLCEWVKDNNHSVFMTAATRAQLDFGEEVMAQVHSPDDFRGALDQGLANDRDFAEGLAEYVGERLSGYIKPREEDIEEYASTQRQALSAWRCGDDGKCISILERFASSNNRDRAVMGLAMQVAAQVAYSGGNDGEARRLQERAYGLNSSLSKPAVMPFTSRGSRQAELILDRMGQNEGSGRNIVDEFDNRVAGLSVRGSVKIGDKSGSTVFEEALEQLGAYLGAKSSREDKNGDGPDVLWVFEEEKVGIVLEAKSGKKYDNPFDKKGHGQLLIAEKWFESRYPGYKCYPISVHPSDQANRNACADGTRVLTLDKLDELRGEVRSILTTLSNARRNKESNVAQCAQLIKEKRLNGVGLAEDWACPFKTL